MPEISRFFGIVIAMHYHDHAPPHIHARYGEHLAHIAIDRAALIAGWLPPRAFGLVIEWASIHRDELVEDWERAARDLPLRAIDPLR